MKIKDILAVKGDKVTTIKANQSIREALNLLVAAKIGSLVVLSPKTGTVAGILSERDIIRGLAQATKPEWMTIPVSDLMTRKIIICTPADEIERIMSVMTERRIRHIPVMEGDRLKGIISIGDVVKALMKHSEHEILSLKEYMYGPLNG